MRIVKFEDMDTSEFGCNTSLFSELIELANRSNAYVEVVYKANTDFMVCFKLIGTGGALKVARKSPSLAHALNLVLDEVKNKWRIGSDSVEQAISKETRNIE